MMSKDSSSAPATPSAAKRRSPMERAAVWLLIISLLGLAGWEGWQRHSYNQTLSALQDSLKANEHAANQGLTLTEARSMYRGWPVETVESQLLSKQVTVKWPSLFKNFQLQLQLGQQEIVLTLASGEESHESPQVPPSPQLAASPSPPQDFEPIEKPREEFSNGGLSKTDPQILMVDVRDAWKSGPEIQQGILVRELGRQALLLAGREELSLPTRDFTIGETFPATGDPILRPLRVVTSITQDGKAELTILLHTRNTHGVPVLERLKVFTLPLEGGDRISQLTAALEPLSRIEFVDLLKTVGYSGSGRKFVADAPLSDEIAARPFHFDVVSQFATIRDIHLEIQSEGESGPRLAALARAYAQLGTLTEEQWSPAHKAFKALALLYAERLVAKTDGQPIGLWNRAFVKALVGLPDSAIADLEAVKKLKGTEEPTWLPFIDAYSRSDTKRLREYVQSSPLPKLATYLHMLAADLTSSVPLRYEAAEKMLETEPDCIRAWDVMAHDGRLGVQGRVADVLYVQLRALSDQENQPDQLGPALSLMGVEELEARAKQLRQLLNSKQIKNDSQEPNLAILRQLVREATFRLAWQTVNYHRTALYVHADDLIEQVAPLVKDHHFGAIFEGLLWDNSRRAQSGLATLSQMSSDESIEFTEEPISQHFDNLRAPEFAKQYRLTALRHSDPILRDQAIIARTIARTAVTDDNKQRAARILRSVAPLSPITAAVSIRHDWNAAKAFVAEWDKSFADNTTYLQAMAEQQRILGKPEESAALYERLQVLDSTFETAQRLASIYEDLGDTAKWRATLEAALKLPSLGLESSSIHVQFAQYHMDRGEWELARPHADKAAESFSSSALTCAAECYQGLQEWKKAEEFESANSQRYNTEFRRWYTWCSATGHGDIDAARKIVEPILPQWRSYPVPSACEALGQYALLENELPDALSYFQLAYDFKLSYQHSEELRQPYHAVHTALLADELGQTDVRDRYLKHCAGPDGKSDYTTVELARLFRKHLAEQSQQPLEPVAVEWILQRSDSIGTVTNLLYFVGKYSELRGHKEAALGYYKRAAGSEARHKFNYAFAAQALRKMGAEVPPPRQPVFEPAIAQAFDLVVRSNNELNEHHLDSARWFARKAVETAPNCLVALLANANLASNEGRFDNAARDFGRVIEVGGKTPNMYNMLGLMLERLGRHADAIAAYEQATRIDPSDGVAYHNLSMLYSACVDPAFRNKAKALELAESLQELETPDRAYRIATLGVAYAAHGRFDEAKQKTAIAMQVASERDRQRMIDRHRLFEQKKPYIRPAEWWKSFSPELRAPPPPGSRAKALSLLPRISATLK